MDSDSGVAPQGLAEGVSSSTVFDAQEKRGALPSWLRRLHGEGTVAGPVVTAACAEGSVTAVLTALETAPSGCVLVVQGSGDWAYVGELLSTEAARVGVVAVVTDGFARDIDQIRALSLSLYARGLTPRGARFGPPGEVGADLLLGETTVRPGDWAIGDADGVTVVRADDVEQVVARAERIAADESALAASLRSGASLLDHVTGDGRALRDLLR